MTIATALFCLWCSAAKTAASSNIGANPNQIEKYYMRAEEIRLIAEGFLDQKDQQALLQYADEIECLAFDDEK